MVESKKSFFFIIFFLLNFFFTNGILEIPLKPIRVKGVPKFPNITKMVSGNRIIVNNSAIFMEEGNSIINNDLIFLANVKIGSDSQNFNLLLDTGSDLFWVAGKDCLGDNIIRRYFIPESSSTCGPKGDYFSIGYGSGKCIGYYYEDNVQYLSNKKFKLKFGVASLADFRVTNGDGIIGLAKSYNNKEYSFIHMLKESGNTDSLAFSIKFENNDYFRSGIKGTMYIGEHNDFSKSETVSCPFLLTTYNAFWACELSSFGLKGSHHSTESSYKTGIIFDTGTNMILLPMKYLDDIKDDLSDFGCYTIKDNKYYMLACSDGGDYPDLRFKFNGNTLIIPKHYAFYYPGTTKYVYSSLYFQDSREVPIMGSIFFFLFHTLFYEEKKELKFYPLYDGLIEKGGLSGIVIAIIVIVSILTVAMIAYIIYYCIKKRKNNMVQDYINQDTYRGLFPS